MSNFFNWVANSKLSKDFGVSALIAVLVIIGSFATCAVAEGQAPLGEHAFNLFIAWENDKLIPHILEPQSGIIDPSAYIMDIAIFG